MLSIVGVTAMFITKVVMKLKLDCEVHCMAFLALITVIETIVAAPRVKPSPEQLLAECERFLELFKQAWGCENMIPKFHWILHYHRQQLLNCFCLERKHRAPKRYAGDITNISKKPASPC